MVKGLDDYYKALLDGKVVRSGLSVLRPEYIILFKAKAYLDLKARKEAGESIDTKDIKKHKHDILRIAAELTLDKVNGLPDSVHRDIEGFIAVLEMLYIELLRNTDVIYERKRGEFTEAAKKDLNIVSNENMAQLG